jgi:dihydroorotate dehydrogenase (fumarate)
MAINSKFMGIELSSPIIVGSSSLTNSIDNLKRAEDFGAGAVVIKSLFEEQILNDSGKNLQSKELYKWYPEAIKNIANYSENDLIEHFLNLIKFAGKSLDIPVFASINCISPNDWPQFALKFEDAGADGIELNITVSPADINSTADEISSNIVNIITSVRSNCTIPVSVKLSPYFSNPNTAIRQIDDSGVDGIILFNKLFAPDIDIENIKVVSEVEFGSISDINNSLRWISLLSDKIKSDLVGSGGVRDYSAAVKYILAGAKAVQVTSALISNGIEYIKEINSGIENWMNNKGYNTIEEFRGLIAKDEAGKNLFNRVQYLRLD